MSDFLQPIAGFSDPDLRTVLNLFGDERASNFYCHIVGTIQSFDAAKQTAVVALNLKRIVYNQTQTSSQKIQVTPAVLDYPLLVDVPVFVLSGGLGVVTCPVSAGDPCLVAFHDRDLDNWFETGGTDAPNSTRMHDLSDGMAFVGFRPSTKPIAGYATNAVELRYGSTSTIRAAENLVELVEGTSRVTVKDGGSKIDVASGITLDAPATNVTGNLYVATGASGSFTTADGATVTVVQGIIINIVR